jgi:predicted transglutaminase-like cysteine proteinase
MRVIILQDLNLGGIIHAVLGIYEGDELYILDNQIKQVIPARKIYHYKPIYAINEDNWWRYVPR